MNNLYLSIQTYNYFNHKTFWLKALNLFQTLWPSFLFFVKLYLVLNGFCASFMLSHFSNDYKFKLNLFFMSKYPSNKQDNILPISHSYKINPFLAALIILPVYLFSSHHVSVLHTLCFLLLCVSTSCFSHYRFLHLITSLLNSSLPSHSLPLSLLYNLCDSGLRAGL